jgi:tetraacyldisaccharide 4'-kinase
VGLLSFILQWANALRRMLYRRGWPRVHRVDKPVIAIGNLGFGGSGKTPVVMALARALTARGIRVVILSRGYGGTHTGTTIVQPNADPAVVGDEPLLLARKSGAAVVVDKNRARGAEWAVRTLAPDLLLLDDGFSHLRLARDLDWLMIGANDLRLWTPRRELRRQRRHAQILATTESAEWVPPLTVERLERKVVEAGLTGKRVIAVAAIARPQRFADTLRSVGAEVVATRFFRDHAVLPAHAFAGLPAHDFIVITEKDAVKMPRLPPRCVVLEAEIALPAALVDRAAALVKK